MYRVNLLLVKTGTQVHSAVWRVFWAQRQIFKILHVSLSHLSALSRFHMIDSSYFCIEHQHQNTMQAAWHIFIWACEWEICCFSSRGGGRRGGGEEEERRGASGNMSVCVGGRGSIKGEEPCKRYGGCLTLSAPVSTVTVTGAWRWQACREARGPCVVPPCVTPFSACQYSRTWHTVLSYYNSSIGTSTECHRSATGVPLAQDNFTGVISASFIAELPSHVQWPPLIITFQAKFSLVSTPQKKQSSFWAYPVLLWVAHAPAASLWRSTWSLLLLSCHGNFPLDALVERSCWPGALFLYWAACGLRPLSTLDGNDGGQN